MSLGSRVALLLLETDISIQQPHYRDVETPQGIKAFLCFHFAFSIETFPVLSGDIY